METPNFDLHEFPGGDLVRAGLSDLSQNTISEAALLVLVARPRLIDLGFDVPLVPHGKQPVEHALYEAIEARCPDNAHSEYNALIQRIVSFAQAYEHRRATTAGRSTVK